MARGRKTTLVVTLSKEERALLEKMKSSRTLAAGLQMRARAVLLLAEGKTITEISEKVGVGRESVGEWLKSFLANRMEGLREKPGRGRKPAFSP